ncbi:MAG: type I restriction enzyme HsdR N-terminal domain-containing protein [Luteibaculum sp.]
MSNSPVKYRQNEGRTELWDAFRKKWVLQTPEEEVRQFAAWYLHHDLGYPKSWIAMERTISGGPKKFRFDMVVFNQEGKPWLLVECKAPEVKLNQTVFNQIFKYNRLLSIPYLWVSNGVENRFFLHNASSPEELQGLPPYM